MTGAIHEEVAVTKSNPHTDIIVKYKDKSLRTSVIKNAKKGSGAKKLGQKNYFKKQGIGVYEVSKTDNLEAVLEELNSDPNVEYAQPNYPLTIAATPTDNSMDRQWAIYNDGQEVNGYAGRLGVDINTLNAWNLTMGDSDVVVGVLDTGIDTTHQDLVGNIYINDGEIAGNGIDDDGNGYIDDVNGWDFSNDNATVYDSKTADTHGTYVAGLIAAQADNGGIVGVAPEVKVLPLKFISGSTGYTSNAIEAIEYAMNMGVKVINCSFGGTDNNQALKDAMSSSGLLFVCSAGNTGKNTSDSPIYPAAFDLDNVISVTSVDSTGVLPPFASYGNSVDVAAPGTCIYSITPGNGYDYYSGTSVSAAIVSGIAALVQSYLPGEGISSINSRIINSATQCASLDGKIASGGRADAYGALTGTVQAYDIYTGVSNTDDILPVDGVSEADTWYIMNELASNVERFHYGEGGVNPSSGNYSVTCTDMSIAAPGFTVNISRTYNSRNQKQTLLGRGWTFGFEGKVTDRTDSVEISLPDGSSHFFNLEDGKYTGEGTRASFVRNAGGGDILTTADQYRYGFDTATHMMIYMQDKNGNRISLAYSNGKLSQITDTVGRVYILAYNSSSLLESVTDPAGRKITYTYNADNLLTQVTDPMGGTLTYAYDSSQFLITQTDQNGKVFQQLQYNHSLGDSENRVVQTIDATGETWSYSYDPAALSTTITNNDGKKWTYFYDCYMNTTMVQDPEGKRTITEYAYNDSLKYYSDVKAKVDRNGNRTEYMVDPATGNTTKITNPDGGFKTFVYDKWNNVTEETNESGNKTYYIYDIEGANLLKKVQPVNGTSAYTGDNIADFVITANTYYSKSEANSLFSCNAAGLLKTLTDPEGNVTTYSYDRYGNIASVTDAAGNTTTYTYDIIGHKLTETTPEVNKTTWEYDANGLVIRVINPDGGVRRTTYDAAGHVLLEVEPELYDASLDNKSTNAYTGTEGTAYTYYDSGYLKSVTDAEGNTTSYTYDKYGNKIKEIKTNGAIYSYAYDVMNRLVKTYFQESSSASEVILSEISYSILFGGNSQTTTTVYTSDTNKSEMVSVTDYAGREVMVQYGDYSRVRTTYNLDGTVQQKTAANGAITYYKYNALGNLMDEWKPVCVVNGSTMYSWTGYSYDKAKNLTAQKTGKQLVALDKTTEDTYTKNYTYMDGFMTQESDSDGRKTVYTYDDDGNVTSTAQSVSAGETQTTQYTYNYRKKPLTVTKQVRSGDIYGNSFPDNNRTDITTTYSYDLNGNLISTTDATGNITEYTYDKLNRNLSVIKQLKNSSGTLLGKVTTSKTYTWDGRTSSETDANGNVTSYTYDGMGNQIRITDALGNITLNYYDRTGNNTAIVSSKNYIAGAELADMEHTAFTYDALGRVLKQTEVYRKMSLDSSYEWTKEWVSIAVKTYEYDTFGNVIKTTDALGNVTEYGYNLAGALESTTDGETAERNLPYTVNYTYNGLGQKVKESHQGSEYEYAYDGAGNLLKTVVNGVTKSSATYDLLNHALTVTDGKGNTTIQTWNAFGKISSAVTPGDGTVDSNTTIYQYDVLGNLKYILDSMGKVTTYAYDGLGRNTQVITSDQAGSQKIATAAAYDANWNVLTQTDGNGNKTTYAYDALNRIISSTNAIGQTTTYTYDADGNLTTQKDYLGNTTTKVYDGINRLAEVRDSYGNVIQQLLYNDANAQTSSYDALHNRTQYLYDKNLRQAGTVDGEGITTSTSYDTRGNIIMKTDGNGNLTKYYYDGENRLTSVVDALGNTTTYTYDVNGNVISQTDGNGNTTTYTYDAVNLRVSKTDPEGTGDAAKTETYTYYANGLMATKTDRNGITTSYTYDVFGRLTSEDAGGEVQSYTYDANNNLLTITDATGTTTRTYDALNRNISKTVPVIGRSVYAYDLASDVEGSYAEKTTDPKGNVTLKTYDRVGRLAFVTVGEETTEYSYYANGNRSRVTYPDGTKESYSYNKNNQVIRLVNAKADGTVISSYRYTYDRAGNQLTKTEEKGTTTYTYDTLNRLSSVTEPGGKITSYTYDGAGNRKTETVQTGMVGYTIVYQYNSLNRLISTASTSGDYTKYIYDNNGNQVSKTSGKVKSISSGEKTVDDMVDFDLIIRKGGSYGTGAGEISVYTYDHYNRLTGFKDEDTTASYQYNAQGYRTVKTVNGTVTNYLYEVDKVVLETDADNKTKAVQVYGSALFFRKVTESSGTQSYYYLYNAHGDVTVLIGADGEIAATYDYDAFGNLLSKTGSTANYIMYAGYQKDDESGLYYLNTRYYDSAIARFITEDDTKYTKKNDPLSLNLYTYCHNEPIMYTDPSGHWNAKIHVTKTVAIVKKELTTYIKNESKNIVVYKTDKKGNVVEDKKGNPVVDKAKTAKEQKAWVKEQTAKVDGYAKAIAAGDQYVDQQKTVFTRESFAGDAIFHGLKNTKSSDFINDRKNTAASIITSDKYSKEGAIEQYIINPVVSILDNKTNAKNSSIAAIKSDIEGGKFVKGSAATYMTGEDATKETAALFVLGMGLHTVQDTYAHGNITSANEHTIYNDDPAYDSWTYNEKTGKYKTEKGDTRITNTETATRNYIDTFLYGDSETNTPGYGSLLFTPSKYSTKNK